jgi:hypothetical protein
LSLEGEADATPERQSRGDHRLQSEWFVFRLFPTADRSGRGKPH